MESSISEIVMMMAIAVESACLLGVVFMLLKVVKLGIHTDWGKRL